MKRILLGFLLINSCLYGQINIELPNLSPTSPTAYQFTKYGEVEVNESTGTVNPVIPIHTFQTGEIEIPIVLNYSGNGVKVAQEPTWAGINWNLTPGGVITRQVRDEIDEKTAASKKKYYTTSELDNMEGAYQYNNSGTEWYTELYAIANPLSDIDSEVDIFNYNFLGYSGSFYLDEDLNTHLIKYDKELDISFQYMQNNKSIIVIKTPEGDSYFFGGPDASESSRTWANNGSGSTVGIEYAQNAFYLYRISPYNGGTINFEYEQVNSGGYTNYVIDKQELLAKYIGSESNCGGGAPTYKRETPRDIYLDIESLVVLKKITSTFSNTYVEFSSSQLGNRKRKLQNVFIRDVNTDILKKVELQYLTIDTESNFSENRFFLQKVDFYDKDLSKVYGYQMEYNSPEELPSKRSYARDYGGYYNGIESNETLLPIHPFFKGAGSLANREVSFYDMRYGSLSKITYPTGGYSVFEYEVPVIDYISQVDESTAFVYHNDPARNGESKYQDFLRYQGNGVFYLEAGQVIPVHLTATTVGDLNSYNKITITAMQTLGGEGDILYSMGIGNPENSTKNYDQSFSIEIQETGNYHFQLSLDLHDTAINDQTLNINASVGMEIPNGTLEPVYFPSLRIKNIRTYSPEKNEPYIVRYYYNKKENISTEVNSLVNKPTYIYETATDVSCGGLLYDTNYFRHLTANALNNVYGDDTGKILYPYVTISYGGYDFEQGGKELWFNANSEGAPRPYIGDIEREVYYTYGDNNTSYANSVLSQELIFKYDNAQDEFIPLKRTRYWYGGVTGTHTMHNIKTSRYVFNSLGAPDIRDFNFGTYDISSRKYTLKKVETEDYPEDNGQMIKKIKEFTYSSYIDRPLSVKTTDSEGLVEEKKMFYPLDVNSKDEYLTSQEKELILDLHQHHRITDPYLEEMYRDGKLQESRLTVFSNEWVENRIWPKQLKTAKTGNGIIGIEDFKNRIEYSYNFYGRLQYVALTEGSTTRYMYNANQQVVLKIENYDPANIDDGVLSSSPCFEQDTYPGALVTKYVYDPDNDNLISIKDPRCYTTYYTYDTFSRLRFIKDETGKLLEEYKYHYKN
ncbi:hypothetical protein OOZ15_10410 [Galbibacter sp. EGI 63066]|uniref:hypothetical protein n=1 Tax=Galbibacter sp. EGI 63066 TaxID=2993559 RepID=UPI0022495CED|nr:hypothetical protein [Galbibacter sp. EGI 63066]MCX2680353.1 hypothetical protein [Galbibacter sp. EGI 63066]